MPVYLIVILIIGAFLAGVILGSKCDGEPARPILLIDFRNVDTDDDLAFMIIDPTELFNTDGGGQL